MNRCIILNEFTHGLDNLEKGEKAETSRLSLLDKSGARSTSI
jgi:hypothetical protein